MGSIIVNSMLTDGSVEQDQIMIYNRTPGRTDVLRASFPRVLIAESAREVAERSDILFICTLSRAMAGVLDEIACSIMPGAHLVMISIAMPMEELERICDGPISVIVPSVAMASGRGVTLMCHSKRTDAAHRDTLSNLFIRSGKVKEVDEDDVEAACDLTSTAPAFIAEMMEQWADSISNEGHISAEDAREMLFETMLGTAVLLTDKGMSPEKVKEFVATKGGITEQGLIVLEEELPVLYDHVLAATAKKRREIWGQDGTKS